MHEDVRASRARISRRRALGLGGTVGLAGVLAACAGPAAPAVPAGADVLALLDSAGTCGLTRDGTAGPY